MLRRSADRHVAARNQARGSGLLSLPAPPPPIPAARCHTAIWRLGALGGGGGFSASLSDDLFGQRLRAALDGGGRGQWPLAPPWTALHAGLVDADHVRPKTRFYDSGTALRDMALAELPVLDAGVRRRCSLAGFMVASRAARASPRSAPMRATGCDAGPQYRPVFIRDEATNSRPSGRDACQAPISSKSSDVRPASG